MSPKGKGNSYPTPPSVQNMFQGYGGGGMPGMMPQSQQWGQGGGFPQQQWAQGGFPQQQWAQGGLPQQQWGHGGGFPQQQWGQPQMGFPQQTWAQGGGLPQMGGPQWAQGGGFPPQQMQSMPGMMQQPQQPGMYPRVKKSGGMQK